MKRKKLYIIILIFSVLGLFIIQYQYLRIGLNLARVQFDRKIAATGKEIRNGLSTENQLTFLIATSIKKEQYFKLSPDSLEDASRYFLNDFLVQQLTANGISKEFTYRLYSRDSTDYLRSPTGFARESKLITYPVELTGYLPAALDKTVLLELQFSDLNAHFLSQLDGLIFPSLLFFGAIILVIVWILRSFSSQSNLITVTNDFINNFTHELKTPVFSIGVATKILEKDAAEQQKPVIKHIRQQVERLKVHIDKVLDLASLEAGGKVVVPEQTDLYPVLHKICTQFQEYAKFEKFSFTCEMEAGPYHVKAETVHFENAIYNLLDNARKYAEEPQVNFRSYKHKKDLVVEIGDNGIGISKKEKDLIFKKFYRVTQGNLHKVKGYGLGLSYVKEVIKKHHGSINVESEKDFGTTISILIPLQDVK